MKWIIYVLPAAAFAVLAGFLFVSLQRAKEMPPDILPSVLIDKPAPPIALAAMDAASRGFRRGDLAAGHVTVVNFFASWCAPCRLEADALMLLSKTPGMALYGVAYKDKPADTRAFLGETGDPFAAIVADTQGQVAIDWGVTAAPETFVIDGHGIIRFKYVGELTGPVLAARILPLIARIKANS